MIKNKQTQREIFGFLVVGGLAFFIDGGVLQALVTLLDASPYVARVFSFSAAVTFTWWMNRRFSFRVDQSPSLKEFLHYLSTQSLGIGVNIIVYAVVVQVLDVAQVYPVLALIPATAMSMIFNFLTMKFLVFKKSDNG